MFKWFEAIVNSESEQRDAVRAVVKDLEGSLRFVEIHLQQVQKTSEIAALSIIKEARDLFVPIKEQFGKLKDIVPVAQFYRFCGQWKFSVQQAAFLATWLVYLENGQLISAPDFEALTSVSVADEDKFHIEVDDFLLGVCNLFPELARLATNSVTAGDFGRPARISSFLSEVYNGFRLLNLKNDALRKRFDGIKYDLKRVEGVVYDISIRNLQPKTE